MNWPSEVQVGALIASVLLGAKRRVLSDSDVKVKLGARTVSAVVRKVVWLEPRRPVRREVKLLTKEESLVWSRHAGGFVGVER